MKGKESITAVLLGSICTLGLVLTLGAGSETVALEAVGCCGPATSSIRSYYGTGDEVFLAVAEGSHGFMITDMICANPASFGVLCKVMADDVEIMALASFEDTSEVAHFKTGIPVPTGTVLTSTSNTAKVTISGYTF